MIAPLHNFELSPEGHDWAAAMILPMASRDGRVHAAPAALNVSASAREQAFDYSDIDSFSNRVADYLTREKLWPRTARA